MNDTEQPNRRLRVTLVVRDEKDDPFILDIVRVAVEDGLRTPVIGAASAEPQAVQPNESPERHSPVNEKLETAAREAVEEALAKVIERFEAAGKEPKFDPARWAEQLSKVWVVIHKAKAAGVQLRVLSVESESPLAEGS